MIPIFIFCFFFRVFFFPLLSPHKNKIMVDSPKIAQKVCLICIDGWGISAEKSTVGDAIRNSETPVMTRFEKEHEWVPIAAHGLAVGLPEGLMGNSEVGHLNIGAGRVVYQDIVRIDLAVKENRLLQLAGVKGAFDRAKSGNGRLHFLGLVSDGGVHGHIQHLFALLKAAKEARIPEVYIHFFADGRDTAPKSAAGYFAQLKEFVENLGYAPVKIASINGRYYAMDRDSRWERIKLAFDGIVQGNGEAVALEDVDAKIKERYEAGETDEFLKPITIEKSGSIQGTFFFCSLSDACLKRNT
jgi:2,3-bisphosphoglycerate-independent phosphoglycerate mutase